MVGILDEWTPGKMWLQRSPIPALSSQLHARQFTCFSAIMQAVHLEALDLLMKLCPTWTLGNHEYRYLCTVASYQGWLLWLACVCNYNGVSDILRVAFGDIWKFRRIRECVILRGKLRNSAEQPSWCYQYRSKSSNYWEVY